MAGSAFGFGSPIIYPTSQQIPLGVSPYGAQGVSNPFAQSQQQGQPLQQILQILQIVPQQLQQLQQLQYVQQQQLQQVQQLLQQLVQFVPQQIQQMQQPTQVQQPFGQAPGLGGYAAPSPWGIAPQVFSQSGHVM